MKNVIIVDDHIMLCEGLKSWLKTNSDWVVIFQAQTSAEFFTFLDTQKDSNIDAVIVDVNVGKENGFNIVQKLQETHATLKCLIYSMYDSSGYVVNAFTAGAKGYVSKGANEQELLTALNAIYSGQTYVQQSLVPEVIVTANLFSGMSKKEKQVLDLVRKGQENKTIAHNLNISQRTVENYLSRIYDKFDIKNREQLLIKLGM